MKEDLAEWLRDLYGLDIDTANFLQVLETGLVLCRHANAITEAALAFLAEAPARAQRIPLPRMGVSCNGAAQPGTFQARDNVSNFIQWCRKEMGIQVQFSMVKVSEGKYRVGDSNTLIFIRILRNHVMHEVRVQDGPSQPQPMMTISRSQSPLPSVDWKTYTSSGRKLRPTTSSFSRPHPGWRAGPGILRETAPFLSSDKAKACPGRGKRTLRKPQRVPSIYKLKLRPKIRPRRDHRPGKQPSRIPKPLTYLHLGPTRVPPRGRLVRTAPGSKGEEAALVDGAPVGEKEEGKEKSEPVTPLESSSQPLEDQGPQQPDQAPFSTEDESWV
ncbi:hypothetical protein CB1_000173011 [Camelus ferus]|nr:hypothetical protein CB1_000173011 [Camelus ferus]